jgi:hypothetical protein
VRPWASILLGNGGACNSAAGFTAIQGLRPIKNTSCPALSQQ